MTKKFTLTTNKRIAFSAVTLLVLFMSTGIIFSSLFEERTSAKALQAPVEAKVQNTVPVAIKPYEIVIPDINNMPKPESSYITANADFSNLQLYEFNKPVYDKFGFWQRDEGGMATKIPELQPFYGDKIVYLTFDDGPDNINTPKILDILSEENVPATFYVLGVMVENNPDVLKRIFDEGHAIGNHSYNHNYNEVYASPWNFIEQFQRTDEIIMSVIGVRPLIIRAPGGTSSNFNADYWDIVKSSGYVEHDWNITTQDASPRGVANAEEQLNNVINQMNTYNFKSAIVLMHSTAAKGETVRALPDIIHFFKDRGYSFGVITPMTPKAW